MLRGRTPRKPANIRQAVSTIVESLEERRLLTTLRASTDQIATFDFLDQELNFVHIQVQATHFVGEFLAARVGGFGQPIIRDLIPYRAIATPTEGDGANLFNIYVAEASADTRITITKFIEPPSGRVYQPYNASTLDYRYGPNPGDVFTPDGGGDVYIGAQTATNIPITSVTNRGAYGVRPGNPRGIVAGIDTAAGVSLHSILVHGTITGHVAISGSLDTFYAGSIYTGDMGEGFNAQALNVSASPNNFSVGGDLHYLLSRGSSGVWQEGTPVYSSGLQVRVGGKLGYYKVRGDYMGSVNVINSPSNPFPLNTPFHEIELPSISTVGNVIATDFLSGLVDTPDFRNDTVDTAIYGSSIISPTTGLAQTIEFTGFLGSYPQPNTDLIDNYAVTLMAGQKVAITLDDGDAGVTSVGVFDPFGRLVATDFPDINQEGLNQTFLFTANTPGTYRLAVVAAGDATYAGTVESLADYTLRVEGVANVALGALHVGGLTTANQDFYLAQATGVLVNNGDIGSLESVGLLSDWDNGSDITANRGNLREVESGGNFSGADLMIPRGSVGYLHSLGSMVLNPSATDIDGDTVIGTAVGFDYQRVEVLGSFDGNIITNRAIGSVIVGGSIATGTLVPHFYANADGIGEDGRIDLIDCTGDFGNAAAGGPGIKTGFGGNVKYIRVGGATFRDKFYGGALQTIINGDAGESFTITDDSGARALIRPTTIPAAAAGGVPTLGALNLTIYGIRESGGVVLINTTTTTSVDVIALGGSGSFDMSVININGAGGTAVTVDPATGRSGFVAATAGGLPTTQPARPFKATFNGRIPINVMSIVASFAGATLTNIDNNTAGELASTSVGGAGAGIGVINAQSVGYIHSSTAADILVASNHVFGGYPLDQFNFGISVEGAGCALLQVNSREDIGNVSVTGAGSLLGTVVANSDSTNNKKVFEGIKGIVYSGSSILKVSVGEGLVFSGTGSSLKGAIIGLTSINQVVANNADIRGTIASNGFIRDVYINNGSLIGANVKIVSSVDMFNPLVRSWTLPDLDTEPLGSGTPASATTTLTQVAYSLGTLRVRGNGGIIGTSILAGDFKAIDVSGGFGILGSWMLTISSNNPNGSVTTDGLGIRDAFLDTGNSITLVEARGSGQRLNVLQYSPSVRSSENGGKFDSNTGRLFGKSTDLHSSVGTSKSKPRITGITNAGIIRNTEITGSDTLFKLKAFMIDANPVNQLPLTSPNYNSRIAFANSIRSLTTLSSIRGLQLTTGRLDTMSVGGHLEYANIKVVGPLKLMAVGGNVRGTSSIVAKGPQGQIQTLIVKRALGGYVASDLSIGNLSAGSILSEIATLNSITNLTVTGDVVSGAYIHATKKISNIKIGGDFQAGATIKAKVFGTKTIVGDNLGNFVVG